MATKKTAAKKTTKKENPIKKELLGVYSVKVKDWVLIEEKSAALERMSNGGWMLRGVSGGNNVVGIVGKAKAQKIFKKYPKIKKLGGWKVADLK
jgi:hypothetical protein